MSEIPPALDAFLRDAFPDEAARLRALHAPVPALNFESALDAAACWGARGDATRRARFERTLLNERDTLNDDALPYFAVEGTGGTLTSPWSELPDGAWWRFVQLWQTEDDARRWWNKKMPDLGDRSSIELLRDPPRPGLLRRWFGDATPPLVRIWNAHLAQIAGNYR